tara:strand:+ start:247 stop:531 length:285 start_codon:yes stop_codon:yes gene_type:complete
VLADDAAAVHRLATPTMFSVHKATAIAVGRLHTFGQKRASLFTGVKGLLAVSKKVRTGSMPMQSEILERKLNYRDHWFFQKTIAKKILVIELVK